MIFFISVGVFLTLCTLILLVYQLATAEKRVVTGRLDQIVQNVPSLAKGESSSYQDGEPTGLRKLLRNVGRYVESPRWNIALEHRMLKAGLAIRAGEFLVLCGGSAALVAVFLLIVGGGRPIVGVLGAAVGFALPFMFVSIKTANRMKAFNSQLGDSLILIANSLRTGYSFMQAADMVAREMRPPISTEFARAVKEMNLGITMENAMGNLAKRVTSEDLDLVLTAVLIQRQVGGNLSEVLDNIAKTIRERVRIRGEIRALTAQGRISGIIVSLLPVVMGIVLYLMNPEYIKLLFTHPLGRIMLGASVVSQVIGIMLIRKIVDIEV